MMNNTILKSSLIGRYLRSSSLRHSTIKMYTYRINMGMKYSGGGQSNIDTANVSGGDELTSHCLHNFIVDYIKEGNIAKAYSLLSRSLEENVSPCSQKDPFTKTYITMIEALCKEGRKGSPHRAHDLLEKLREKVLEENKLELSIELSRLYNLTIEAWLKSKEHLYPIRAQELFDEMSDPKENKSSDSLIVQRDYATYSLLVKAWSSSRIDNAPKKASTILEEILELSLQGVFPQVEPTLLKQVLRCWCMHTTSKIKGFSFSQRFNSAKQATWLLYRMEKLSKKHSCLHEMKPDLDCYKFVLESHSMCTTTCFSHLMKQKRRLEHITVPDLECYEIVLKGLSKCNNTSVSFEAKKVLDEILDFFNRGDPNFLSLNTTHFELVLDCFLLNKYPLAGHEANEILQKLKVLEKNNSLLKIHSIFLQKVIQCWSHDKNKNKASNALLLLQNIEQEHKDNHGFKPKIEFFNAYLNVVCHSSFGSQTENKKNLSQAIQTLQYYRYTLDVQANLETFLLLFQACSKLLPKGSESTRAMKNIFYICYRNHQINEDVLNLFRKKVTFDVYNKVISKLSMENKLFFPTSTNSLEHLESFLVVPKDDIASGFKIRNKTKQKLLRGGRPLNS